MYCIPEIPGSIPLVLACIDCWINKIPLSVALRTWAKYRNSLNIVLTCFLYCFSVLVMLVYLWLYLSLIGEFLIGCCPARITLHVFIITMSDTYFTTTSARFKHNSNRYLHVAAASNTWSLNMERRKSCSHSILLVCQIRVCLNLLT